MQHPNHAPESGLLLLDDAARPEICNGQPGEGPQKVTFCRECVKMLGHQEALEESTRARTTMEELRYAALSCAFCQIMYNVWTEENSLPQSQQAYVSFEPTVSQEPLLGSTLRRIYLELHLDQGLRHKQMRSLNLAVASHAYDETPSSSAWRRFPTSFENKLELLRQWTHECDTQHPLCTGATFLQKPSRLIEIGHTGRSSRIVSTATLSNIVYATLSYCWGIGPMLQLTSKTIETYSKALPPEETLPLTYQEAFHIARCLQAKYIWIDALCIVQDDKQDWQQEAHKMHGIYAHSYLTIAASVSDSCYGGWCNHKTLPSEGGSEERRPFFLEGQPCDGQVLRVHGSSLESDLPAIDTRAWTLQELVLSRRTIEVLDSQLKWRCRTLQRSEILDTLELPSVMSTDRGAIFDLAAGKLDRLKWYHWLSTYTSRTLTQESDRLAAIHGLISACQRYTGLRPCLGLWQDSLILTLGWVVFEFLARTHSGTLSLPTWSPLGHQFSVYDHHAHPSSTLKQRVVESAAVVDYQEHWEALPYLSRLQSSRLTIRGTILKLPLPPRLAQSSQVFTTNVGGAGLIATWNIDICWDDLQAMPAQTLPCLLLYAVEDPIRPTALEVFLVLTPCPVADGEQLSAFRRIGRGTTFRNRLEVVSTRLFDTGEEMDLLLC